MSVIVNRQARLFALAEHLRGRRTGVTAETLAERFGVTVRTIYRDLDTLRDAHLPVQADRGRGGGYALDRTYALPPIALTAREAALLVRLGEHAAEMRLVPFADTLRGAVDKVRAALQGPMQRELVEHMKQLHFTGVPALSTSTPVRKALEQAWFEHLPLRITYRGHDDVMSERTIAIENVVMERALTLINARDLDKGEKRQFRLDRIEAARVVDVQ
jgi:predicted DNA-binding transcriptional regulator YafY